MEIKEKVNIKIDVLRERFSVLEKEINEMNDEINKMNNEMQQQNQLILNKRIDATAVERSIKHLEELL